MRIVLTLAVTSAVRFTSLRNASTPDARMLGCTCCAATTASSTSVAAVPRAFFTISGTATTATISAAASHFLLNFIDGFP